LLFWCRKMTAVLVRLMTGIIADQGHLTVETGVAAGMTAFLIISF